MYRLIALLWVWFAFLWWLMKLNTFPYLYSLLYSSMNHLLIFFPIGWLFSFYKKLICTWFKFLVRWICYQYLFHSVTCFFIFSVMSFDDQKVLIFMWFNLTVISFMINIFFILFRKSLLSPRSWRCLPGMPVLFSQ